jgi:hypothetical protein
MRRMRGGREGSKVVLKAKASNFDEQEKDTDAETGDEDVK